MQLPEIRDAEKLGPGYIHINRYLCFINITRYLSNQYSKLLVLLEIDFSCMKPIHSATCVWEEMVHIYMEE